MGFFDQIYISAPILGAITASIVILAASIDLARTEIKWMWASTVVYMVITVVFSAAGAVTPFAYSLNPTYGILHYSIVLLCVVTLCAATLFVVLRSKALTKITLVSFFPLFQ